MAPRTATLLGALGFALIVGAAGALAEDPAPSPVIRETKRPGSALSPAAHIAVRRMYRVHRGLNASMATPERMALIEEIRRAKSLLPTVLGTRGATTTLPEELAQQRDRIQERIDALQSAASGAGQDPSELSRFQEALDAYVAEVQSIRAQPRSAARSKRAERLLREARDRSPVRDEPGRDHMSEVLWRRWASGERSPSEPKAVVFDEETGQARIR